MFTFRARLVAEDGSVFTDEHCEGELFVKGASMMNGYFKDPVSTTTTIDQDGWLRAEDVASHVKVKWYIVNRKKVVMGESVIQSEWTYGADRSDRSSSNSMGGRSLRLNSRRFFSGIRKWLMQL